MRWPLGLLAAVLVAGACSDSGDARDRPLPTIASTTTEAPTTTTTALTAAEALAQGTCPTRPPRHELDPDRPTYRATVEVLPDEGRATGALEVRFIPDLRVEQLVFRLWANAPRTAEAGGEIRVTSVEAGSEGAEATQPDPTTLVVRLGEPLDAGDSIEARLEWEMDLPSGASDRMDASGGAVRLGGFMPLLAWEPGVGWSREPPTGAFAEAASSPAADYAVTVAVPGGYGVMASGRLDADGTWQATGVRDFAVSVGRFSTATATIDVGDPVEVSVGVHEGLDESAEAFLAEVVDALRRYSLVYGAYPWPTLSLAVTPGLDGGIEFPSHIMQGPGTLGRTTAHEVGHMWFYGLVGNNQGRDPWLDESLATWAEGQNEGTLEEFRSVTTPEDAVGRLGEPMAYWSEHESSYYRGVYIRGAAALGELGPPALVDCALAHYVADNAWQIAVPEDLLAALEFVFPDAREVLLPVL